MSTTPIADATWYLDLNFMGAPRLIATGVLETEDGLLLVDPGPASTLEALEEGLAEDGYDWNDVAGLLLTHIHLDHAGGTGTIVKHVPHVQVYVHQRGARHLVDPTRLLRSAQHIYGDMLDKLWGAVEAVPDENVHALTGGEQLQIGARKLDVAYTPGHAVHHVSFFDRRTGTAFIGDVGGLRVAGAEYVLPVAPPPDIHLDDWHDSIEWVQAWAPERLFVTHFGAFEDVDRHLRDMDDRLDAFANRVRADLRAEDEAADPAEQFHAEQVAAMKAETPAPLQPPYEHFGRPKESWHGLARYWRKRG